MIKTFKTLLIVFVLASAISCSKSIVSAPLSSITVVNAVISSPGAQLNTNTGVVYYPSYGQFSLLVGNSEVYVFPSGDSAQPYYNSIIPTINSSIYSLYLAGVNSADTILVKESIPTYTDSSCGMRFINLSPDSRPVSINIAGLPSGSEVSSLSYKSISPFKTYSANSMNTSYNFEIRDAASDSLIASYTQTTPTFHNVTIVFNGLISDQSFSVFTVNNF